MVQKLALSSLIKQPVPNPQGGTGNTLSARSSHPNYKVKSQAEAEAESKAKSKVKFAVKSKVKSKAKRKARRKHVPQNTHEYALAQLVCALVSIEFGVTFKSLMAPTKGRAHQSFARQVAMYLMHVVFQTRYCGVAAAFGRDQSTVSYACRLIENERDDQMFDERLQKMEDFLNSAKSLKSVKAA